MSAAGCQATDCAAGRGRRVFSFGLKLVVVSAAALVLAACEKKPPVELPDQLLLIPTSYDILPGWGEDTVSDAVPALIRSCARLLGQPDARPVGPGGGGLAGTVADWRPACAAVGAVPAGDDGAARAALEAWFAPFKAMNNDRESGLFTGYYEAELRGALAPDGTYRFPLYRKPPDLITVDLSTFRADLSGQIFGRVAGERLVPYFSREEIERGAIDGEDTALLWSDDPVDVFFLHVQGSGQVTLPDGTVRRVGFAASNGLDFYPIGRALLDEGKVSRDNASMQAMRAWLRAHPTEAAEIMRRNARYIFFRWIDGDGPIGSQGVALTPGRSLAVDPAYLPLGVPVFLDTTWPGSDRPLRRLLVAQDTGSAIKGPLRGDFFWGAGEAALAEAGRMKQSGKIYILLPKPVAERRKITS
ncbi:MAG TPA: murein transglycosylase A [Kiloniellales bacterium]